MAYASSSFFSDKLRHHDITTIVKDYFINMLANFLFLSNI